MELIKIEKYLDTPTTSCDTTSNVNDCYFLVPEKLREYFTGVSKGLVDLETNKNYIFPVVDGREFRLTQFNSYINDKHITMGDKIIIHIVKNNDNGLSFYIDIMYSNFFLQTNAEDNLYKLYVTKEFQDLFESTTAVDIPLSNGETLKIEKIGNEYALNGLNKKKFILEKDNEVYKVIDLERASVSVLDATLVEDASTEIEYGNKKSVNTEEIKELFAKYIDSLDIQSKKIDKRIKYLDEILPKRINVANPTSIFNINDIDELEAIRDTLRSSGENWEWDRNGSYAGEILQTIKHYIKFLENRGSKDYDTTSQTIDQQKAHTDKGIFKNFLKQQEISPNDIDLVNINTNIQFNIGQPNTGKSYNFEESRIFNGVEAQYYKYLKIPVSGGIGNEYKGLQNTDLAITYDPIKEELRFGEFLQMLMSAIVNPKVPHVVFLDDFHNQDISSLLSEYTPLFKGQQRRPIKDVDDTSAIYKSEFRNIDDFIEQWNNFISIHCADVPTVPLTNRISGDSLKLVYPANFYLLGAANFNENSLNIFADWADRASIGYIDPIKKFNELFVIKTEETEDNKKFLECCKELNIHLKEILESESKSIFDYEKYCFGMWKIVDSEGAIISDIGRQENLIDFFFAMIKNSLKFNNKNSEINTVGWELMQKMQGNNWFKEHIQRIDNTENINCKILHQHNIYEGLI